MKNSIIPQEEINAVKKVIEAVEELSRVHASTRPVFNNATKVEAVHTFTYLNCTEELFHSTGALKQLLDVSEEEFVKVATGNGKRTIEQILEAQQMEAFASSMRKILNL